MTEDLRKRIEKRAYEIFLARGGAPGDPQEDWLRAEREIMEEDRARCAPAAEIVSTDPADLSAPKVSAPEPAAPAKRSSAFPSRSPRPTKKAK